MSARPPEATATIAVRVDVAPAVAFDVFVREIDQWWRRGPKFRHAGKSPGTIRIEPCLGGAVVEAWRDGGRERSFELGRITHWQPPDRLAFTFRNATFAPLEQTEVEVTFAAVGSATLVTVRHSGWEALRADHPARHGMGDRELQGSIGSMWGDLLTSLRELVAGDDGVQPR